MALVVSLLPAELLARHATSVCLRMLSESPLIRNKFAMNSETDR
jgi:hypothetical protein